MPWRIKKPVLFTAFKAKNFWQFHQIYDFREIDFFMALTPHDIERISSLARLTLRPDETERTRAQINSFFTLVAQMEAVDTEGVEPLAHPAAVLGDVALRLREDSASEPNQREASQLSAPAVEQGLFLVPKVIE